MKTLFRKFIVSALTAFARIAIYLHRPKIIAITGSVGKTTVTNMVVSILKENGLSSRGSIKSYNGDIGVPLSIFGLQSGISNPFKWIYILFISFFKMLFSIPKYIVLEVGLETPGDITGIVKWLKPDISTITLLAKNPVHLERFNDKESLYKEKLSLFEETKNKGAVVWNGEDEIQKKYISNTSKTFNINSFNSDSIEVVSSNIHYDEYGPIGTDILIKIDGSEETFYMPEVIGEGVVQSLVASLATVRAISKDIPITVMRKAIASRPATPGRMHILGGKNGSVIIDDSYNASPIAMEKALQTLSMVDKKKKIAILGVMAEIGDERDSIHKRIGEVLGETVDTAFIVGDANYGNKENILYEKDHKKIIEKCLEIADKDTVFLCKGSQVSRVEKIVKGLISEKVNPKESLVRQEGFWLSK